MSNYELLLSRLKLWFGFGCSFGGGMGQEGTGGFTCPWKRNIRTSFRFVIHAILLTNL